MNACIICVYKHKDNPKLQSNARFNTTLEELSITVNIQVGISSFSHPPLMVNQSGFYGYKTDAFSHLFMYNLYLKLLKLAFVLYMIYKASVKNYLKIQKDKTAYLTKISHFMYI